MNDARALHLLMQRSTAGQRRGCFGKMAYPSKKNATARALQFNVRDGNTLQAYKCSLCGSWHIGHSNRERAS